MSHDAAGRWRWLCGTDHEQYTGELAGGFAFVPGHGRSGRSRPSGAGRPSGGVWQKATGWPSRYSSRVVSAIAAWAVSTGVVYGTGASTCTASSRSTASPGCGAVTPNTHISRLTRLRYPCPTAWMRGVATLFNPLGAGIRWGVTAPGTKVGDVVAVLDPGIRGCVWPRRQSRPVPRS
jgi:alcohol dehydrogenase